MIDRENDAESRQRKREAEYDQKMAEARIELALIRYKMGIFIPPSCRKCKPNS